MSIQVLVYMVFFFNKLGGMESFGIMSVEREDRVHYCLGWR